MLQTKGFEKVCTLIGWCRLLELPAFSKTFLKVFIKAAGLPV
jgi:hypothetical protein